MGIACEVWLNETEKPVGKFEFDTVPRSGETIALPAAEEGAYTHYRVEHVTHRAHGPSEHCATFLFVAAITELRKK
jgi:hypothetical protein